MLQVGITGGIGSGKSFVCKVFASLGIPVYYADERAKELMLTDEKLKQAIIAEFGENSYKDGKLNRQFLAQHVFKDKGKLETLNSIVHPRVNEDYEKWVKEQGSAPYTVKEAAILIETGSYKNLDVIILVRAPRDLRINRVLERDQADREAIEKRMEKQWSDDEKVKFADFIIDNDNQHHVIPQVMDIHKELLKRKPNA